MKFDSAHGAVLAVTLGVAALAFSAGALAVDEEAAKALAKKNDCTKCHAADKDKKAMSYKKIAAKYKGKADAEETLTKSISSGPKVKFADGSEESHKILNSKDAKETKNLVQWILAQ